jgi:hypothetical protein
MGQLGAVVMIFRQIWQAAVIAISAILINAVREAMEIQLAAMISAERIIRQ